MLFHEASPWLGWTSLWNEDYRVMRQGSWWQVIKRNEAEFASLLEAGFRTGKAPILLLFNRATTSPNSRGEEMGCIF